MHPLFSIDGRAGQDSTDKSCSYPDDIIVRTDRKGTDHDAISKSKYRLVLYIFYMM